MPVRCLGLARDLLRKPQQVNAEPKMTQIDAQAVPNEAEISAMAAVLARRYGAKAGDVARHFILEHEAVADTARASLWAQVHACLVRRGMVDTPS